MANSHCTADAFAVPYTEEQLAYAVGSAFWRVLMSSSERDLGNPISIGLKLVAELQERRLLVVVRQ